MTPLDDRMPSLGDLYACAECGLAICCHPAGASPPMPFHVCDLGKGYLEMCGAFTYQGKCPDCEAGTCPNQHNRD